MNRNSILIPALFMALLLATGACKPTEANYRVAYDAAQRHRTAAEATDSDLAALPLQNVNAPQYVSAGGIRFGLRRTALIAEGIQRAELKPYNVAVSAYRMRANAGDEAGRLRADGYDAFLLRDAADTYYVIAAACDSLPQAGAFIADFRKRYPDRRYIGLSGESLVLSPVPARNR